MPAADDDRMPPPVPPRPDAIPPLQWGMPSLRAGAGGGVRWLWHGYLAAGALTLLSSRWKTGKTTLTAALLARMKTGGTFAGLPLQAGRAVVLSEESPAQWVRRGQKLDLEEHVGWYCRPFRGRPRPHQWQALIDQVAEAVVARDVRLVVVDPLAAFYPGKSENDAAAMLDALAPLQGLASQGPSVLMEHHPAKHDGDAGPSARGSGALLGCADILIEMRWYPGAAADDRRRRLVALSRFDETPRQRIIELNAEGTDYVVHDSVGEADFAAHWQVLQGLLRQASGKRTRREILRQWPTAECPDAMTLHRWLRRAVALGLLRQDGRGTKFDPFRYWLPEMEERWLKDPLSFLGIPGLDVPPPGDATEPPSDPAGPATQS
jgi:hypothetical protein